MYARVTLPHNRIGVVGCRAGPEPGTRVFCGSAPRLKTRFIFRPNGRLIDHNSPRLPVFGQEPDTVELCVGYT